jgi:hypothetical protein
LCQLLPPACLPAGSGASAHLSIIPGVKDRFELTEVVEQTGERLVVAVGLVGWGALLPVPCWWLCTGMRHCHCRR